LDSKELRKRLRHLGKEANHRFPYLNNGGCCVFAAAVAGELKRLKVEHEVIVPKPYDGTDDLDEIRQRVDNVNNKSSWNNAGIYFSHVAVRAKLGGRWHTYDSDSLRRSKYEFGDAPCYTAAKGGMTAKEAKALADERHGWNSMFDRRDVAPVRKLVKEVIRNGHAST
jgi:hypothetical protein